jgi:hypothetical protein
MSSPSDAQGQNRYHEVGRAASKSKPEIRLPPPEARTIGLRIRETHAARRGGTGTASWRRAATSLRSLLGSKPPRGLADLRALGGAEIIYRGGSETINRGGTDLGAMISGGT